VNAIRGERDSHCAVALGLRLVVVDLGHLGEVPKVNLTLQVAKAAQHHDLGERAHADSVAVPLSKFEKRCAVLIVECCDRWLDASNDDEILAVGQPANIVNRVVETRHERAVSPTENLDVLQCVLSIITLSGLVGVVLGPDQNSVARRAEIRVDLLTLGTLDHKLRLGRYLRIQIKSVDDTNVIFSRHDFSGAPRKEVKRALLRLQSRIEAAEIEPSEVSVDNFSWGTLLDALGIAVLKLRAECDGGLVEATIRENFD
jgi:hypothetical protein